MNISFSAKLNLEDPIDYESITSDELREYLQCHERIFTNRPGRKEPAVLIGRKLEGGAFANFNLSGATLKESNWTFGNFSNSELRKVSLVDCDLTHANFSNARHLIPDQMARCDISRTVLPSDVTFEHSLAHTNNLISASKKLFTLLLVAGLYCILSIFRTNDIALLTDQVSSVVPFFGSSINPVGFFVIGPCFLAGLHFYMLLYMQRMWEEIATLPAIMTDGRSIDRVVTPWTIVSIVRSHLRILRAKTKPLNKIQIWTASFLIWFIAPIIVSAFWFRFLTRHDYFISIFHCLIVLFSIYMAIYSYRKMKRLLRSEIEAPRPNLTIRLKRILPSIIFLSFLIFATISFINWQYTPLHTLTEKLGYRVHANFRNSDISKRSEYWYANDGVIPIGSRLADANLNFALADNAYARNSDFSGTRMEYSSWRTSDFTLSILRRANCRNANFSYSDFSDAILDSANFSGADLRNAKMTNSHAYGTILYYADLSGTNLRNAVGLKIDQLGGVTIDNATKLPDDIESELRDHPSLLKTYEIRSNRDR